MTVEDQWCTSSTYRAKKFSREQPWQNDYLLSPMLPVYAPQICSVFFLSFCLNCCHRADLGVILGGKNSQTSGFRFQLGTGHQASGTLRSDFMGETSQED